MIAKEYSSSLKTKIRAMWFIQPTRYRLSVVQTNLLFWLAPEEGLSPHSL